MKEATGELNMTLVTVLAVAAILAFVTLFLPRILGIRGERNESFVSDNYSGQNG